ncbi:MAG: PEP-CTERM sorting domain-containing protein [Phycisphaerales bacterium]
MKMMKTLWVAACLLTMAGALQAGTVSLMVGDNDGYGLGIPDNGNTTWSVGNDWRSAAEQAATDGAQFTDCYSALFPSYGPNPSESGSVLFALAEDLTSATLTIDMGDFQATVGGQVSVTFNGLPQANLLNYDDGYQRTRVRQFVVPGDALALANAANQFVVGLNHAGSGDFVAFDFFQLDGVTGGPTVPVPGAVLLGTLGAGLVGWMRRRSAL